VSETHVDNITTQEKTLRTHIRAITLK